ncbi:MAG: ABC transporter permease [Chromatiales bacterium]
MRLSNVYRLGLKELRSLRYDPVLIFLIVYAFTIAVYSPAEGVKLELDNGSVAIVDEDRSDLSRRIADGLREPYFRPPEPLALGEVDQAMERGRYTFVIDIPPHFERDLLAGREPTVQLNVDATAMTQAGMGAGYIERIVAEETRAFLSGVREDLEMPVEAATRIAFNPNAHSSWFLAVMQIVNQTTLLAIVLTGAAVIREREHGTIEHLLVMPLTPAEIMLSKVWANGAVIVAASLFSLLVVVRGLLDVPLSGSVAFYMAGMVLYLFSLTAIGIFLATVARSMPQFGLLSIPVFVVLYMLSGANTPFDSMPEPVQWVMMFSPATHFVAFSQGVLFRGAGLEVVWPHLLAVASIGAVFFLGALVRFRKTMSVTAS